VCEVTEEVAAAVYGNYACTQVPSMARQDGPSPPPAKPPSRLSRATPYGMWRAEPGMLARCAVARASVAWWWGAVVCSVGSNQRTRQFALPLEMCGWGVPSLRYAVW